MGHLSEELLLRFLRGETDRAENRAVVRHLLTGCRRREDGMNEVDQARARLRRVVETLEVVRSQLLGLQAGIPPTLQETSLEDLEGEPDAPTAIRAALAGALRDRLEPLIEELKAISQKG